ncbi:MAG: hypothetical protein BGN84_15960 [Afipia sp. 62-7]|nr:MAG: hypothetical protein BGN84_15960 [Afipia sp. 62-7]
MSFYDGSAPVFIHTLTALSAILTKAEAYAKSQSIDPDALLNAQLHPTMYPLKRQVQAACDAAARGCARFAQLDMPSFPDTETTFAELHARIDKVVSSIKAIAPDKFDGADKREITFPSGPNQTRTVPGQQYLNHMALPNFFFHCTTAYDILRHKGVELGKRDFLGA